MTTGTVDGGIDAFGGDDLAAILGRVTFGLPIELGNELHRPQIGGRIAMTLEAPPHIQRLHLLHFHHLVHAVWQETQLTPTVTCDW